MDISGYYAQVCDCPEVRTISNSPFRGKCSKCGQFKKNIRASESNKPDVVINAAEAELENANYHSIGSLPSKLFHALKPLVPSELHLKLAHSIIDSIRL